MKPFDPREEPQMQSTTRLLAVLATLAALSVGCSGPPKTASESSQAPPAAASAEAEGNRDASVAVVAGSYEDWCEEHQVPETQCTRCDPSLIPAFKAAGDWDEEHGLPKSQCLKCDPNLKIVRPPKPEGK